MRWLQWTPRFCHAYKKARDPTQSRLGSPQERSIRELYASALTAVLVQQMSGAPAADAAAFRHASVAKRHDICKGKADLLVVSVGSQRAQATSCFARHSFAFRCSARLPDGGIVRFLPGPDYSQWPT
jgi:hypothetical protein